VSVTRRTLLEGLLVALGWRARETAADSPPSPPGPAARAETLSDADVHDLVAFGEIVVEGRPLSPTERQHLVEHVESRVKLDPEVLALYRTAIGLLDRLAGARFSSLDVTRRTALITQHRLGVSKVRPGEPLGPFPEDERTVRTRVVPDLVGAYYRSASGWAVVGYAVFPGVCGDLERYTRSER
jgi:hypothetical protein